MQISSVQAGQMQMQGAVKNDANSPFFAMKAGDSIMVEVVEAQGGRITVQTEGGKLVTADFPGAPVMQPGDTLELMMTDKSQSQVNLRLVSVNGQNVHIEGSDLQIRLMDLGVGPSEVNTKAAQYLVDRNVQPTAERIGMLIKVAAQYPQLPSSLALFMVANNIPATQRNVDTLMQWLMSEETLGEQAQKLSAEVMQLLSEQGAQPGVTDGMAVTAKPGQANIAQSPQDVFQNTFTEFVNQNMPKLPEGTLPEGTLPKLANMLQNRTEGQARMTIANIVSQLPLSVDEKVALSQTLFAAYKAANTEAAAMEGPVRGGAVLPEAGANAQNTVQVNPQTVQNPADPQVAQNTARQNPQV
ncbi:MAG TPA: hypothetical protein DEB31_05860, partial [Clostridiales bacterium]|nr:hypothetical protein [Clostridiales bacterium]